MSALALLGGEKEVKYQPGDIFNWPIVTREMEQAALSVLRAGKMSGNDITRRFEETWADWHRVRYALGMNNGTAALQCAMYGLGIGPGDEIICPSITYWASCLPVFSLGGTVRFADIEPDTLCLDPEDLEKRIGERTRAVVVVHYAGYPADMDRIIPIARKHGLKIIEDVSHAHGGRYRGRLLGTLGDAAAFSMMSSKSFAIGEGGMLITDDREVYERAIAFGLYIRHSELTRPELLAGAGLPWGGHKYRMHQVSSAVGLEQVKKYPAEMDEIDRAMNYFCDQIEGVPGIRVKRPDKDSGSDRAGWYAARALYDPAELGGLSVTRFCEALRAEGAARIVPGCNKALHLHPLFNKIDVYGRGRPTNAVNPAGDPDQRPESLPVSEGIQSRTFALPWFKRYYPLIIEEYAAAVRKVAKNHDDLLADDQGDTEDIGGWNTAFKV